ncbi:site-specific DNA-methyltransferase [Pectobacterium brasiliense]|uniref:site-specific DNA-methyltransferase n=1 Tax=Pectobacterium brasiliense TaxID=180957 RepID=UPI001968FCA4|nr:site-specific DNA-methyltransferase [Pectobacterium brasiliense]QSD34078.1 site-specific DNA-methyltransferase [Pectobacterium brasiliense]
MIKKERNTTEFDTINFFEENSKKLKALFPEIFKENHIDYDILKQLLGDDTNNQDERYGFNWNGKRRARQLALTPSRGTLRPIKSESKEWATTQNLMIEGDNLEVLKLLQKSYAGKVKLIFIDPPYNTGNDFVYPDDFQDNLKNYLEITNQTKNGIRLTSNVETSGRYHTDWLNMIYPRLKLAKNLLKKDGVILVTLDDNESANLRLIMNELFGEESFVGVFPWRSRTAKADVPFGVSNDVEWVIAYANKDFLAGREGDRKYYKTDDFEDRWRLQDLTKNTTKEQRPNSYFTIVNPKNGDEYPANSTRTWSVTPDTIPEYLSLGKIVFPGDYAFLKLSKPAFRVFESEDKQKAMRRYGTDILKMSVSTYLPEKEVGRTEHGSKDIRDLFGSQVFPYPKPVSLLDFFIRNMTNEDDIILDFFAGSGTTGHAVFKVCAEEMKHRRFILVQLPVHLSDSNKEQKTAYEYCRTLGVATNIAELTKERLRRAGKKVREDNPEWNGDVGFRVFKLDTSNIRPWEATAETLSQQLDAYISPILEGRSQEDLLAELMLKRGIDLCVNVETRQFDGLTVSCVDGGKLFTCFASQIPASSVEELTKGIIDWHKSLKAGKDTVCYFLDDAFENNVAKTNLCAILEQHGLTNLLSL